VLEQLFTRLSETLNGSPAIAVTGSFIWGVLSIVLSPCHLASIPLIIGFVDEQGRISTKRAFGISVLFASGILVSIALIGLATGLLGRMLGDLGQLANYLVAVIFFVMGAHLLGLIPLPFLGNPGQQAFSKRGLPAAFIMGLVFGISLGPCTYAYMAPMLGIAFAVGSAHLLFSALLILSYAAGHASVIVFAGTFTGMAQKYIAWNKNSRGPDIVKKVCGALVILGGIYLIWSIRRG
jgi:cytochrome c-type biogenesis protein